MISEGMEDRVEIRKDKGVQGVGGSGSAGTWSETRKRFMSLSADSTDTEP